jgi:hypothetical protein
MIIDDKFLTEQFDPSKIQEEDDDLNSSSSDDKILNAVIKEGRDATTDCLLKCLQKEVEKVIPYAKLGGPNGLRMARSAFALFIKFSDMLEDFVSLVD